MGSLTSDHAAECSPHRKGGFSIVYSNDSDEHKHIKKTIKILLYNQIPKTVIHSAPPSFTYSLFFPIFFFFMKHFHKHLEALGECRGPSCDCDKWWQETVTQVFLTLLSSATSALPQLNWSQNDIAQDQGNRKKNTIYSRSWKYTDTQGAVCFPVRIKGKKRKQL